MLGQGQNAPHAGELARRYRTLAEAAAVVARAETFWDDVLGAIRVSTPDDSFDLIVNRWLIYQALAGVWPPDGPNDADALGARPRAYVEKALREAKIGSNWQLPDFDYEQKVIGFVEAVLGHQAFLRDFAETLSPFLDAGLLNSLSQTLIKLTAPGIPDIYQGSECYDFSLVDPDNRAPLALASLGVPPKPPAKRTDFPQYKQWLVATVLAARNRCPDPFDGPYFPLDVTDGSRHALAFLRGTPQAFAIVAVPRLALGRVASDALRLTSEAAAGIAITVPPAFRGRTVRSVLGGAVITLDETLSLSEVLADAPVGLLVGP